MVNGHDFISFSTCSFRLLLLEDVAVDRKDYKGYTPLHTSAKIGNEWATKILLKFQCDANIRSGMLNKTPLHLARSPKIVQILLSNGADPNAVMQQRHVNTIGDQHDISAFVKLICANQAAAKEVLQYGIRTNGKDLNSSDLLLIFDFKHFQSTRSTTSADITSTTEEPEHGGDEMLYHSTMIENDCSELLTHPLTDLFLTLKWSRVRHLFLTNFVLSALYAISFTLLTIFSANACRGYHQRQTRNSTIHLSKHDFGVNDCLEDQTTQLKYTCYVSYIVTLVLTIFIAVREFAQLFSNWINYFLDWENWTELIVVILSCSYLGFYNSNYQVCSILGAFCGFLAWMQFTILFGRFPTVGIYIFMSFYILKPIIIFLSVYSTTLLSFALAFHLLLSDQVTFSNPATAVLKVLTMMMGEFDFDNNFIKDETRPDSSHPVTAQFFFVLFYICVSIVLSNLIVGMTVSKTEELFNHAKVIKLTAISKEVISMEKILLRDLKSLTWFQRKFRERTQIFQLLKRKGLTNPVVCVSPNKTKQHSNARRKSKVCITKHRHR